MTQRAMESTEARVTMAFILARVETRCLRGAEARNKKGESRVLRLDERKPEAWKMLAILYL